MPDLAGRDVDDQELRDLLPSTTVIIYTLVESVGTVARLCGGRRAAGGPQERTVVHLLDAIDALRFQHWLTFRPMLLGRSSSATGGQGQILAA
jgi:hypothetical protein